MRHIAINVSSNIFRSKGQNDCYGGYICIYIFFFEYEIRIFFGHPKILTSNVLGKSFFSCLCYSITKKGGQEFLSNIEG